MTFLDAAYQILKQADGPLHYREITEQALAQGLIQPAGLTPEATMGSRLYTNTKQESSLFVRVGRGIFGLAEQQPQGIDAEVQKINRATRGRLKKQLHAMPPDRFEALIGELLIQMGFDENTVTVTRRSNDGGIDVMGVYRAAGLTEVNAAVQVKRWQHNVGAPVVTQLRGSLEVNQHGIIITTSDFTAGARREAAAANKTHIGLINGKELIELLIRHRVGVVEKMLQVMSLDEEWWGELLDGAAPALPIAEPAGEQPVVGKSIAGHKPVALQLFGKSYAVSTWKEVLLTVASVLADKHGNDFASTAVTLKGRKRQYIAPSLDGMINPERIPGTELWIEANQSAKSTVRLVERLLVAFSYDAADPNVFEVDE